MVTGYYDCSGQPHNSEFITLAGVIASDSVWMRFSQEWRGVLERFSLAEFHMTDAIALRKTFSPIRGWSRERVNEIIWELWAIFGRFRATDGFRLGTNLIGSSCTIQMVDYKKAKADNFKLRSPEAICTQFCVNVIPREIDSNLAHPEISLVFDQNEKFRHPICRNWERYRNKRDAGWPRQIKAIRTARSSDAPPLQAADFLAWVMNTKREEWCYAKTASGIRIEHYHKTYDYEAITLQFPNG